MPFACGRLVSLSLCALALGACDPPSTLMQGPGLATTGSLENDYLLPARSGLGTLRQELTVGDGPNGQQVLYINYDAVTITRAANDLSAASDDATTNHSWIPNTVAIGATVSVPAFDATPYLGAKWGTVQAVKDAITQHVVDWYAAYNVYVVTTRPASGRYTMVVVGGLTTQVITGVADAVGVASLDCGNDLQNNIGFAFSASEPPSAATDVQRQLAATLVAQTIAHEAGHTFGLEHVNSPMPSMVDVMQAAVDPNVFGFLSGKQALHDGSHAVCPPTTDTQEDTNARLLANLGPAPAGPVLPKPIVTWLAPKTGSVMPRTFTAAISASEPPMVGGTITKVEIVQSGVTIQTLTVPPYQANFSAPPSVPDGSPIRFTAVAYNSLGGKASVATDFTLSASGTQGAIGCLVAADCMAGSSCTGGTCVAGPNTCTPACAANETCQSDGTCAPNGGDMGSTSMLTPVIVGAACTDSSTCGTDGICASAGSKMYCTKTCDPADTASCPTDYQCAVVGADHYCGPKHHGCEMSRSGAAPSPLSAVWALFVVGAVVLRSRRSPRTSET